MLAVYSAYLRYVQFNLLEQLFSSVLVKELQWEHVAIFHIIISGNKFLSQSKVNFADGMSIDHWIMMHDTAVDTAAL